MRGRGECCQCASVASFQCCQFPIVGCRGVRRAEAARVPLPRGAARWRARAGRSGKSAASPMCGALVCAGEFARAFLWVWEGFLQPPRWRLPIRLLPLSLNVSCLRSPRFPARQRRISARGLSNLPIQSKNLIAFRVLDLIEYPPRAKKRDD